MTNGLKVQRAAAARSIHAVLLVEIDHPAGMAWFNTGTAHIDHDLGEGDGERTWLGTGLIGAVNLPELTTAIEVAPFTLEMAVADGDHDWMVDEAVRGRPIRIFLAFLRPDGSVLATEPVEAAGVMDTAGIDEDQSANRKIAISCLGNYAFLARQSVSRWTPEHQASWLASQGEDPNSDTGFDAQHGIPEQNVSWYWP